MKQLVFMAVTLLIGTAGAFALSPVYGIAIYYMYAVLRPQFIWDWVHVLGVSFSEINWSLPVALITLFTTLVWRLGLWSPLRVAQPPWYGNPQMTRSHLLFFAFAGWIVLGYFALTMGLTRDVPGVTRAFREKTAYPNVIEYIKIFIMFISAVLVVRTIRDLWIIYFVILGCLAYIAYELNFYYFAYYDNTLWRRGYGGLDNNGAALMLSMGVPMCYFAWEATRRWWRWVFLAFIPVILHVIMLSHSRGSMVALCATAVIVWLRARNRKFISLVYGGVALFILVAAGKEVRERFLSVGQHDVDASANSRKTTWLIGLRMATEEPIFGYGLRNSNLIIERYGADIPGRTIHSQYLQTAADSGWVALGLYVALLGSVFLGLWQTRRALRQFTDPETQKVRSLAAGLEGALVQFCIGALFLSLEHFEMPYIIMVLAVQLHAITRAVMAKLNPSPSGLPPLTLPYPYPANTRPVPVSP